MLTPWGDDLDPDHVLPEYPRPQLVRDSYLNLNGRWDYAITPRGEEPVEGYDGQILVPFSPESPLSGVERQLQPDQTLWYRRTVTLPDGLRIAGGRLLLHFGAVDQTCRVMLNGTEVGRNHGGYLPFTCDVTDAVREGGNELVVEVHDVSDSSYHARGKQRLHRGNIWYTAQSGIWQTVWMESVPAVHVERLTLVPHLDDGVVEVTVHGGPGTAEVQVLADGVVVATGRTSTGTSLRLVIPAPRTWSPEDPYLYDVRVRLGDDEVTSYVGMRSFGIGPDADGVPRLLLNGRPYFHTGVLDQGYWPDGLYTPASDAAMVHDIVTMKRLGFTMLRKHIKVEPLRWYHHCDRLGVLVWQDMVNGGTHYHRRVVQTPGHRPWFVLPDRLHRFFGRSSKQGREEFLDELRRTVELLRNVVSLAVWVPFNEGWGQFDARRTAHLLTELDPTRTIDHASGWHDQGAGDLRSLHVYARRFMVPSREHWRRWLRRGRRALVLSEYGGYSLAVPGHTWGKRRFGYRTFKNAEALGDAFARLHEEQIRPAVAQGLSAVVYTQLSDVEDEVNGLLTYDRRVVKLDEDLVRRSLAGLRLPDQHGSPVGG
ncbi:MAG TPA: glycoside hydrolase family 2 TIM barrel-domain containing protein [Nocardioidaceae bacterium]|nr:glycoside hydrolase family 2 TIM barrel-domain containing protein [Nocardioidaceae bacterium]